MRLALCPLLAFLSMPTMAADEWPHEAECRKWTDVPIPQEDIGTAPADCDAQALYYGIDGQGRGQDFVAARHCAYGSPSDGDSLLHDGLMFGGSGVLMMLYANGQGVERNIPLAKRFACEYDGAPAETEGRLHHLDEIARGVDKETLDICDDITSGMMMGFCSYRDAEFARNILNERWPALQACWTPAQRSTLAALRKAADAFFDSASGNEVDMSGTARSAFATDAYEALDIALLEDVERFEKGDRPGEKPGDSAAADKALNAAYKRTLAKLASAKSYGAFTEYGTIDADGVRETQRLWLPYRDAWVAFAAARYPDTPADAWRAWLSNTRGKALAAIIEPGDP
jgi:uncharacterized protein YecT (DUF1311 family)